MKEQAESTREQERVEAKRPYTSPELARYGTIEEITAVKSPLAADSGFPSGQ